MASKRKKPAGERGTSLRSSTTRETAIVIAREARSRRGLATLLVGTLLGGGAAAYLAYRPARSTAASGPTGAASAASAVGPAGAAATAPTPSPPGGAAKAGNPSRDGARLAGLASPTSLAPRPARIDPYALAAAIAAEKKSAVRLCYERELKRNPRLHGRVTVDLKLKSPHQVGEVRVRDNLRRASFTRCVQTTMQRISFPVLAEDLSIEMPFQLTSPNL